MNETFICAHCGREYPIEDRYIFDGQELCRDCYRAETCICDQCGERIWLDDDCGDAYHMLCQDCVERYYDCCADCGRLVELDRLQYLEGGDDDGYCSACFDRHLQSYCYKPEPIFYCDGFHYLGVKLEIDHGGEDHENARRIQAVANEYAENIYIL